ncbi:MAG: nucleoside deaminase [Cyanobacteria bacterium SID2]|nr:nucleoside deaminase [Cyanobacteria bacterium SID2]MBP0004560.1 nucleoside deaminase [Cyanobacteria bacterium SBC]
MSNSEHRKFLQLAIDLAVEGVKLDRGGPFGAIIVKDGEVVGTGNNRVTSTNDPTAHAEIVAIRNACQTLDSFHLKGCTLYTSCEPCPMCLGAIYWARIDRLFYACTQEDAAKIDFDDSFIYREIERPIAERQIPGIQLMNDRGLKAFQLWQQKTDKTPY